MVGRVSVVGVVSVMVVVSVVYGACDEWCVVSGECCGCDVCGEW